MIDVALGEDREVGLLEGSTTWRTQWTSRVKGEKITSDIWESKLIPNAELDKTTQHHKPWLQTDTDDKALQSVMI